MSKTSAGLLMYKFKNNKLKFFLVHPGGPFHKNKDKNVWSIPKGEQDDPLEELINVAKKEFDEETGIPIPNNANFIFLDSIKQKSGKKVYAWAFENNWEGEINCKTFVEIDYNGKKIKFPEVDKGEFFDIVETKERIIPAQFELVERLIKKLGINTDKKVEQTKLF